MMKHFELWCAATRRVLRIEACSYFKTHLIHFVRIAMSVGFFRQEHTPWRHTAAYDACLEILWSLATGLQIPELVHAWKMLEQYKSHIKPWLRKWSLGFASVSPQCSTSLACDLSFHQSFWVYSAAFVNECFQNLGVAAQFCSSVGTTWVPDTRCLLVWCGEEWWGWWWHWRIWLICSCRETLFFRLKRVLEYTTQHVSLSLIDTQWNSCSPNTFCFSSSRIVIYWVARLTSKSWIWYFI